MGHSVSDKRVYCHEALHLKEKLTKAGYKEKVEKWDSDSDSSDEEDDANLPCLFGADVWPVCKLESLLRCLWICG